MLVKKTSKNQITLPKEVLKRFPSTEYFEVRAEEDRIVLIPVKAIPSNLTIEDTLEELVRVLHYPKFGLEDEEIDFLIYVEVLPYAEMVNEVVEVDREICRDRDDIKFLECAVSGKVDYIVSGDDDLISVREIEGIKIITPAELRRVLR